MRPDFLLYGAIGVLALHVLGIFTLDMWLAGLVDLAANVLQGIEAWVRSVIADAVPGV